MGNLMMEKAAAYDKNGVIKTEIAKALAQLNDFRAKFPFAENPQSIDWAES